MYQWTLKRTFPLLLMLAGLVSACSEEKSQLDNLQLIDFYVEQGNDIQALILLGKEIESGSNLREAYRKRGELMMQAGFYRDAVASLESAVELGCSTQCTRLLIDGYLELRQIDKAELLYRQDVADKSTPSARYQSAMLATLKDEDLTLALKRFSGIDYDRARDKAMLIRLQLNQQESIAGEYSKSKTYTQFELLGYSFAFYNLNRYEAAEDVLQRLRLMQTGQLLTQRKIQAVESLVRVKIAQGNFTSARAIYESFMASHKDTVYAKYRTAIENLGKGEFDQVIDEIDALYSQNPDSIEILRLVALAEFGKKNYQAVVARLAVFEGKLDVHSRLLLAASLNRLGRPYEVIALYDGIETDQRAALELARAHALIGDLATARQLTRDNQPSTIALDYTYELLKLWLQIGEYDRIVQAVTDLKSERLQVNLLAVESHMRRNRVEDARSFAASVAEPSQQLKLLAYIEVRNGDPDAAIGHYLDLLKTQQAEKTDYEQLATLYSARERFDDALNTIKSGFQLSGSNNKLIEIAVGILNRKAHTATRTWLDSIPEGRLDYAKVQLQLARHELAKGQRDSAIQRLNPLVYAENADAMHLMAGALAGSDPQESLRLMELLIAREYTSKAAVFLLGNYIRSRSVDDVRRIAGLIEKNSGINVKTARLLGNGYLVVKDYAEVERVANEIEKQRFEPIAMELRGDLALARDDPAGASSRYRKSVEDKMSDRVYVKYLQSSVAAQADKSGKLIAEAESVLRDNPEFVLLRRYLGTSQIGKNNKAAATHLQVLLERFPRDPALLNNLAWLNLEGQPRKALDYSTRAFELRPSSFEIIDTHVRALVKNNRKATARDIVSRQMTKTPDDQRLSNLRDWLG